MQVHVPKISQQLAELGTHFGSHCGVVLVTSFGDPEDQFKRGPPGPLFRFSEGLVSTERALPQHSRVAMSVFLTGRF